MSLEHKRYQRQVKAGSDKHQLVFTSQGVGRNPKAKTVDVNLAVPPDKKVTCPFCLGLSEFRLFLVSTKKGISRSMVKCPLCKQGLYLKTVVGMSKWTAAEYAGWVQPYSRSGFWKKVNFNLWKRRLELMGWTQEFWDRYKELKGEDRGESYEDWIMRKQTEQHEQEVMEAPQ